MCVMSLSDSIFSTKFYYNPQLVEKYVDIVISSSEKGDSKRCGKFKELIFRMMKDIVNKNIANYLNLIRGVNADTPTHDDLIADCYFVLDKCVGNFKTGAGYDFYYYYNKSLARNFFREYQRITKSVNRISAVEITEVVNENTVTLANHETSISLVLGLLNLTELERRICDSKLSGERVADFMERNADITQSQYVAALNSLKNKIKTLRENGQ